MVMSSNVSSMYWLDGVTAYSIRGANDNASGGAVIILMMAKNV